MGKLVCDFIEQIVDGRSGVLVCRPNHGFPQVAGPARASMADFNEYNVDRELWQSRRQPL